MKSIGQSRCDSAGAVPGASPHTARSGAGFVRGGVAMAAVMAVIAVPPVGRVAVSRAAEAPDVAAAQQPADSPIVLFWELPPRDTEGVASGITGAQGWTFSTAGAIGSVELFVDGVSEGDLPCCSGRKDVMDAIEGAPLRTGFNAVMSWGRFAPGLHDMELVVRDSKGNELRETRKVRTVKILPDVGFTRGLSLLDAVCDVTDANEITCTGVEFEQGTCAGTMRFRWLDGKQAFEVIEGCTAVVPTPQPTATPALTPKPASTPTPSPTPSGGPTPSPGPTGSQTIADCLDLTLCPDSCITDSTLSGWALFNILISEGQTRTFCAPVLPPYVGFHPDEIRFEYYDESDLGCGYLEVEVEQTTGAMLTFGDGVPNSGGTIRFRSHVGLSYLPERTEPGIYRIRITGAGGCATTFRLAWNAL